MRATCNNCHGNHGAVPPAVGSVANACGTCHGKIASLFADTRMKHRFEEAELPGCATCHSSHKIQLPTDKMVGMRERRGLHELPRRTASTGPPWPAPMPPGRSASGLDELNQQIAQAEATLAEAERLGMEVSEPKFDLRNAVNALTNARTLLHSFQVKPVEAALADGEKVADEGPRQGRSCLGGIYLSEGMAGRVAGAHLDRHRHAAPLHSDAAHRQAVTLRPIARLVGQCSATHTVRRNGVLLGADSP